MPSLLRPLAFHVASGVGLALALGSTAASAQTSAPPPPATTAPAPVPPPPQAAPPPSGYSYGQYPNEQYPYGYPYPGYAPPARAARPRFLPYHDGQRIPPGYYLDQSMYRGPVIAGAVVLGAPYMLSVAIASGFNFDNQSGWLALPAIGPFITAAARHNTCPTNANYASSCSDDAAVRSLLVLDGLMQTTGAVLLIWGLNSHHKRLAREDARYFVVAPTRVGSGYGLGVMGRL